jgi:hypothetical protein
MQKTLLTFFLFLPALFSCPQRLAQIDFDKIEKQVKSDTAKYARLLNRFVKGDSTLNDEELRLLYYGKAFQRDFNPFGRHDLENSFWNYYSMNDFEKAIPVGEEILRISPFHTKIIYAMLMAYGAKTDTARTANMAFRYYSLLRTIWMSGDGKNEYSAFVVLLISDEYELVKQMELETSGEQVPTKCCDVITLKQPNHLQMEKIFFNTQKISEYLQSKSKKK